MSAGLEVADVFRRHGEAYRRAHDGHLGRVERRVMSAIELCRTAALGGHTEACADCGLVRCAYNSCRNRHCPKCQGQARAEWLAARQAELLPVPYFHVVFTLPAPVAEIAFQNKADGLRHPVPRRGRDAAHHRRRSEASRRRDRPRRRAPHLGPEPAPSSARPLRRAGRRPLARRHALGRLPARLLPAGPRALAALPPPVPRRAARRLRRPAISASSAISPASRRARRLRPPAPRTAPRRLGRLCQAALRRTRPGARLSRPLHPPRRHRQLPPGQHDRHRRRLPLEGLSPPRQVEGHDARRRRVHPPLPAPHPAGRLPSHPPLTASSPTATAPPSSRSAGQDHRRSRARSIAARAAAAPWSGSASCCARHPLARPSGTTPRDATAAPRRRSSGTGRRSRPARDRCVAATPSLPATAARRPRTVDHAPPHHSASPPIARRRRDRPAEIATPRARHGAVSDQPPPTQSP